MIIKSAKLTLTLKIVESIKCIFRNENWINTLIRRLKKSLKINDEIDWKEFFKEHNPDIVLNECIKILAKEKGLQPNDIDVKELLEKIKLSA